MSYLPTILQHASDPEELELSYQQAVKVGAEEAFAEAVEAGYAQAGDNLLLAAWHYRLAYAMAKAKGRVIAWGWAIPLGVLNGLLLWLLSDDQRFNIQLANPLTGQMYSLIPLVALLAAPISVALIALFLTVAGSRRWARVVAVTLGLAASAAYVLLLFPRIWPRIFQEQYLVLMMLHLGLLAWAGVGVVALARRRQRGQPLRLPGQVAGGLRGGRAAGHRRRAVHGHHLWPVQRPGHRAARVGRAPVHRWRRRADRRRSRGAGLRPGRRASAAVLRRGTEQAGGAVDAPAAAADGGGAAGLPGFHPLQLARALREPRGAGGLQRHALRRHRAAGGRDAGAGRRAERQGPDLAAPRRHGPGRCWPCWSASTRWRPSSTARPSTA